MAARLGAATLFLVLSFVPQRGSARELSSWTLGNSLSTLLISDSRFLYEPGFGVAQVQSFLEGQPGPLKEYRVEAGGREQTAAEVIYANGVYYRVNPKLLLVLIEVQSGLITNPSPAPRAFERALGDRHWSHRGFLAQLTWAAQVLATDYGAFAGGQAEPTFSFFDGTTWRAPQGTNAATLALYSFLASTNGRERWEELVGDGPGSFLGLYRRFFEDPRQPLPAVVAPLAVVEPFLHKPVEGSLAINSYFDHEYPIYRDEPAGLVWYQGQRRNDLEYSGHAGYDYEYFDRAAGQGRPVLAAAAGTVSYAGYQNGSVGNVVLIGHNNGYSTLYAHLSRIDVRDGDVVSQGSVVGLSGATGEVSGPHLHFEVRQQNRPTDPYGWCPGELAEDPWAARSDGTSSQWLWADFDSPCTQALTATVPTPTPNLPFKTYFPIIQSGRQG